MAEFHGFYCPFQPLVLLIEGVGRMGGGMAWRGEGGMGGGKHPIWDTQ